MNLKTLVQNMLLILGSLVIAAVFSEVLLRMLLPLPIVWKYPQEVYVFDSETGHHLKPNQQSFTHDKNVSINSQGLRDVEYPRKPGMGVTRILALGDSQTFGNGIALENTWPKQLEHELNITGSYEVLNGGVPATDTWQHEKLLQRLVSIYHPHIVVLAFYVNDIVSRPSAIRNVQVNDAGTIEKRTIYLLKRSALILSLKAAVDAIVQMISPRDEFVMQQALLAGESNPVIDSRWNQVVQSLAGMKKFTENNGIKFLVVSLPRRDQVDGRLPADKYNRRLSAVMEKAGVKSVKLLGPLQEAYKKHGKAMFIPWDGHNTPVTNRVIAKEISTEIEELMDSDTNK